jgi:predicted aminopeptidase
MQSFLRSSSMGATPTLLSLSLSAISSGCVVVAAVSKLSKAKLLVMFPIFKGKKRPCAAQTVHNAVPCNRDPAMSICACVSVITK